MRYAPNREDYGTCNCAMYVQGYQCVACETYQYDLRRWRETRRCPLQIQGGRCAGLEGHEGPCYAHARERNDVNAKENTNG